MPVAIMMRCFRLLLLANGMHVTTGQMDLCPGSSVVDASDDWVWDKGASPSPSCMDPAVENNAQMCDGDPTSIVMQADGENPQCLAAKMPDCKFNMNDLQQMDFDIIMSDCVGTWAAPLWVSPSHWEGGGKSGEIDMLENCPSDVVASNFAGGERQIKWPVDPNGFSGHVTLWNTGEINVKLCDDTGGESCSQDGDLAVYGDIYGANGCSQGDCMYTFISDIWNGNSGDEGFSGCTKGQSPHFGQACGFSIRNIRLQAKDGAFSGKCEALTNGAPSGGGGGGGDEEGGDAPEEGGGDEEGGDAPEEGGGDEEGGDAPPEDAPEDEDAPWDEPHAFALV